MWKNYCDNENGMGESTVEMISRFFMDYLIIVDKCLYFDILTFSNKDSTVDLDVEERACMIMVVLNIEYLSCIRIILIMWKTLLTTM